MESLGVGRTAVVAMVGMLALSGCQATQGESAPEVTSSPSMAASMTAEVTASASPTSAAEQTVQPAAAWAVTSITSAEQCALFTDAMLGDLDEPALNAFELAFSTEQHPGLAQLSNAAPEVCTWRPAGTGAGGDPAGVGPDGKWRATFLHIATVPGSETFDPESMFDEFESFTEGFSVGTTPYSTQELGDGTVSLLENVTHGETVPADICHYVERQTVVTILRAADGHCVTALEQAIAVAKG